MTSLIGNRKKHRYMLEENFWKTLQTFLPEESFSPTSTSLIKSGILAGNQFSQGKDYGQPFVLLWLKGRASGFSIPPPVWRSDGFHDQFKQLC